MHSYCVMSMQSAAWHSLTLLWRELSTHVQLEMCTFPKIDIPKPMPTANFESLWRSVHSTDGLPSLQRIIKFWLWGLTPLLVGGRTTKFHTLYMLAMGTLWHCLLTKLPWSPPELHRKFELMSHLQNFDTCYCLAVMHKKMWWLKDMHTGRLANSWKPHVTVKLDRFQFSLSIQAKQIAPISWRNNQQLYILTSNSWTG